LAPFLLKFDPFYEPARKELKAGPHWTTDSLNIAGTVAAMTESDPRDESESASENALGWPGQRHEAGKAFGC
jgi:hypothetical protein